MGRLFSPGCSADVSPAIHWHPLQVAAFHSLVGLAAVCASISSYMASDPSHLDGVHMTATFLVRPGGLGHRQHDSIARQHTLVVGLNSAKQSLACMPPLAACPPPPEP